MIEYKDLNFHLEQSWKLKYDQLTRDRDIIVETLKSGSERALLIVKSEYEKKIQVLSSQFKEDILKVDQARKEAVGKAEKEKAKYQQAVA